MQSRRRNLIIIGLVLALIGGSVYAVLARETRLGLDLSGGIELVYEAIPNDPAKGVSPKDLEAALETIRKRTDALGVAEPEIQRAGENQISVGLPNVKDPERAKKQVGSTAQLFFYKWEPNVVVGPDRTDQRLDEEGASNRPYNGLYDAVQVASKQKGSTGKADLANDGIKRAKLYLFNKKTKSLFNPDDERDEANAAASSRTELLSRYDGVQPKDSVILTVPRGIAIVRSREGENRSKFKTSSYYVIRDNVELTGEEIRSPRQIIDPRDGPAVSLGFSGRGSDAFQRVTKEIREAGEREIVIGPNREAASHRFAIVLDGQIESLASISNTDPSLSNGISGGAQITGLSISEARDLARQLEIGALPISLKLVSQTQVSATLGRQALNQGVVAGLGGVVLVLLFLLGFYRILGVIAGLALVIYALYFFALIKIIPITLTLPGIAGLVLTLSVAADANIVIFERIKEEVRAGRSIPASISTGFARGFRTILDANVVTLITAFILFTLATAGVKGFAFALGVGTLVSLFTAVLATSAILGSISRSKLLEHRAFLGAGEAKARWQFNFMGASKYFFSASGIILAIGAFSVAGLGLNLGIDFESGTRIQAGFDRPANEARVRDALSSLGYGDAKIQRITNPTFGANAFQISSGQVDPTDDLPKIQKVLDDRFSIKGAGADQQFATQSVGPTFGASVARTAIIALIASLLVIAVYIALRFSPKFAVPVLIALAHDILITVGVYALIGREVSSATVAALLTILGFSLYDTIIVFDRIRENIPRMTRSAFSQIVNRSMSEVLTRSLATSLVTALPITSLLVFGGETLRDFAFALLVGTISGTYSSIFIASPVLYLWKEREPMFRQRRERIAGEHGGHVPAYDVTPVGGPAGRAKRTDSGSAGAGHAGAVLAADLTGPTDPTVNPVLDTAGATDDTVTGNGQATVPAATAQSGRPTTKDERRAARERRRRGGR